jgi:hypothetical protein
MLRRKQGPERKDRGEDRKGRQGFLCELCEALAASAFKVL